MSKKHLKKSAPPVKEAPKGKNGIESFIKDMLLIIICAFILSLLIKSFIIDSRQVPSTSMVPTIQVGDRVVLWRLSYAFNQEPQRGDIIVLKPPAELNEKQDLLKRIIGLPGEEVEIKEGHVYINGTALEEDYLQVSMNYAFGPVTVPDASYFVLGDNRDVSIDSHMWLNPFLPEDHIKGKAIFRYWPLSRIGGIY